MTKGLPRGKEEIWFTPLAGAGTANGIAWQKGDYLLLSGDCDFSLANLYPCYSQRLLEAI